MWRAVFYVLTMPLADELLEQIYIGRAENGKSDHLKSAMFIWIRFDFRHKHTHTQIRLFVPLCVCPFHSLVYSLFSYFS